MSEDETVLPPEGYPVVREWLTTLFSEAPDGRLWSLLDDNLRLVLAQQWAMQAGRSHDDSLAAQLMNERPNVPEFKSMLAAYLDHWRQVYDTLKDGCGIWDRTELVGIGLELVVLTAPEYIGDLTSDTQIPGHTFITNFANSQWRIAATSRRMPVAGWPPTERVVAGLSIDGN